MADRPGGGLGLGLSPVLGGPTVRKGRLGVSSMEALKGYLAPVLSRGSPAAAGHHCRPAEDLGGLRGSAAAKASVGVSWARTQEG